MSSVTEGLGSTVLDAMAMRLAVVGTHAGGIPEAVAARTRPGCWSSPREPRELAGAIVRLLKDRAFRKKLGDAGHARVTDQFGVARLLEGTLAVYRKVTVKSGREAQGPALQR